MIDKQQVAKHIMCALSGRGELETDARRQYRMTLPTTDLVLSMIGVASLDWSELSEATRERYLTAIQGMREAAIAAALESMGMPEMVEAIGKEIQ